MNANKANYLNASLCNVLAPACKDEIRALYAKVAADPRHKLGVLRAFQEELARIKDRAYEEFDMWLQRVIEAKSMFWLPDLVSKVVAELCAVCGVPPDQVPDVDPVLLAKACLINAAREVWKQPYLLYHNFEKYETCRNLSTLETLVNAAIVRTIHDAVPKTFCANMDDARSELIDVDGVLSDVCTDDDEDGDELPGGGCEPIPEGCEKEDETEDEEVQSEAGDELTDVPGPTDGPGEPELPEPLEGGLSEPVDDAAQGAPDTESPALQVDDPGEQPGSDEEGSPEPDADEVDVGHEPEADEAACPDDDDDSVSITSRCFSFLPEEADQI